MAKIAIFAFILGIAATCYFLYDEPYKKRQEKIIGLILMVAVTIWYVVKVKKDKPVLTFTDTKLIIGDEENGDYILWGEITFWEMGPRLMGVRNRIEITTLEGTRHISINELAVHPDRIEELMHEHTSKK